MKPKLLVSPWWWPPNIQVIKGYLCRKLLLLFGNLVYRVLFAEYEAFHVPISKTTVCSGILYTQKTKTKKLPCPHFISHGNRSDPV